MRNLRNMHREMPGVGLKAKVKCLLSIFCCWAGRQCCFISGAGARTVEARMSGFIALAASCSLCSFNTSSKLFVLRFEAVVGLNDLTYF